MAQDNVSKAEVYIWADATAKDWYTLGVKLQKGGYTGYFSNIGDAFVDCGLVKTTADLPIMGGYILCVDITSKPKGETDGKSND